MGMINILKMMPANSRFIKYFILFVTISFFNNDSIAQRWEMREMGNAFDGFGRMCAVNSSAEESLGFLMGIVNECEPLELEAGTGKEGFLSCLHIRILLNENLISSDTKFNRLLMSFDKERTVYEIGRFSYDESIQVLELENAFLDNFNEALNRVDIINLFKIKSTVNFRLYHEFGYYDFSFSLSGSSESISKTFKINNYKKKGDWTDFAIEMLLFSSQFSIANDGDQNLSFAAVNCWEYVGRNFGEYYYLTLHDVRLNTNQEVESVELMNLLGEVKVKIPLDSAFRNVLFMSGYPKIMNGDVYVKDEETIEIYYKILADNQAISMDEVSLTLFKNYGVEDLNRIFEIIKRDKKLLEQFRVDPNHFIDYSENDYDLKVFIEAWGYK